MKHLIAVTLILLQAVLPGTGPVCPEVATAMAGAAPTGHAAPGVSRPAHGGDHLPCRHRPHNVACCLLVCPGLLPVLTAPLLGTGEAPRQEGVAGFSEGEIQPRHAAAILRPPIR